MVNFPKGHKINCKCPICCICRGESRKLSKETISKMIESRKWYKPSKETKRKIGDANRGKPNPFKGIPRSEETRQKMRIAANNHKIDCLCGGCRSKRGDSPLKGYHPSEETRKKMSDARMGISPWNKGIPFDDDVKKKMSESKKGNHYNPAYEFEIGHPSWNKGLTKETDKRLMNISIMQKQRFREHPELHPGWKGGVSPKNHLIRNSIEMDEWRIAIFKRDDYTCQYCHEKGGVLRAHHIKAFADYPDDRLNIDNGITLCEYCHRIVHSTTPLNQQ